MKNNKIVDIIKNSKKVAIFTHTNPDPDAFGSAFAVKQFLTELGKQADVFAHEVKDDFLEEMFDMTSLKTNFKAKDYDTVIITDLNSRSRIDDDFAEEIAKAKNVVIFDHHRDGDLKYENTVADNRSAATCQILTKFMHENDIEISKKAATYLWIGLMGDTGRFLHSNLTAETLDVAKVLYEKGANIQWVYDKMYRSNSIEDAMILHEVYKHTEFFDDSKIGVTVFTLKDQKKLSISKEKISKYNSEIINLKQCRVAFLAIETEKDCFKIGIRTKNLDCQVLAKRMGGGGHTCASGFNVKCKPKQITKLAYEWGKEILK